MNEVDGRLEGRKGREGGLIGIGRKGRERRGRGEREERDEEIRSEEERTEEERLGEGGGGEGEEEDWKGREEEYSIIYNITPHVNASTKHKPDTIQTYTPQPSTPIKHAGSKVG